ncbi:unnamed protein product, partial [Effrenium voratum]
MEDPCGELEVREPDGRVAHISPGSYALHVLRGLPFRGATPPELGEGPSVDGLGTWRQWQEASYQLWQEFLEQCRRRLGSAPLTGLPAKSSQLLVLIEMRQHQDLEVVLRQSLSVLATGQWAVLLVCGSENFAYCQLIIRTWRHVHLWCLPTSDFSRQAYADFRRSEELLVKLEAFGAEVALFL